MIFGYTCDPRPPTSTSVKDLMSYGAQMARFTLTPDYDATEFILGLRAVGINALPVVTAESLPDWSPDWLWSDYASTLSDCYGKLPITPLQLGNEPDLESPSSWTLEPKALNALLKGARSIWPQSLLVGPGMAGGDAAYLDDIDLSLVDAVAVHPYGRRSSGLTFDADPGWAQVYQPIEPLLDSYRSYKKPIWVTEFGAPRRDFISAQDRLVYYTTLNYYFSTHDIPVALAFCLAGVDEFSLQGENPFNGGSMTPQDVAATMNAWVQLNAPDIGKPWYHKPLEFTDAEAMNGAHIRQGWAQDIWIGKYFYGYCVMDDGEFFPMPVLNDPRLVKALAGASPF